MSDVRRQPEQVVHLLLRGRRPDALVRNDEDWQAVSTIARRMLFWCGGSIHGCRCEGGEMRFALQVDLAPVGAMAGHISGTYASHLRRSRGWTGPIFHHYSAIPVDAELFLDDLVVWLHRPPQFTGTVQTGMSLCWTANSAYLSPNSSSWITTDRVLTALSPGGAGRSAYLRRLTQPITPDVVAILTGRAARRMQHSPTAADSRNSSADPTVPRPPSIESIAQFVARFSRVSYQDMRSTSRRRELSRAKIVAAVLATRNGASVAAVARLFGRSRSTLIERAEGYRQTQPQLFDQAEQALGTYFESGVGSESPAPRRIDSTPSSAG
jgi:transposase-like protein